jgi:hypothetical protein
MTSLLHDIFGGEVSNTLASMSLLCRTMLYKDEYCSGSMALPSHLSSQNLIFDPSLLEKEPYGKKNFFIAIIPSHKCESSGFQ